MATDTDLMDEREEEEVKLEGAGMEELEGKSESSTGSHLPPPPPLQRAPQYRASRTSLQERRGEGPAVMVSSTPVRLQERVQREEAEDIIRKYAASDDMEDITSAIRKMHDDIICCACVTCQTEMKEHFRIWHFVRRFLEPL